MREGNRPRRGCNVSLTGQSSFAGPAILDALEPRLVLSAAPVNLAATTVSQSEVNLTWDLADAADTAIVIERKTGAGGTYQTLTQLPGGESIFTDISGWASTTYYYRVKTRDAGGDSAWCTERSATTSAVAAGAMAMVTNFQALAASTTTATITFTDTNTADSGRSYLLERSADGVSYRVVGALAQATSWTDAVLTPGATYYYRLRGASWTQAIPDYTAPAAVTLPARTVSSRPPFR